MHLKGFSSLLVFLRWQVEDNNIVGCRDSFGAIVNLLPIELLIYAEPLEFLVGIINIYGGIFYQMYLLPQLTIPYPFLPDAVEF